ncbi:hypothetical protein EYF80_031220 [Liparis tanakae]|uniref:Uncharacterized protein n=1 Tax=Liparis tanakae TaxID=230148 RepID=A0A4Z2GZC4_9TELE|nr:hypothetical protein EYF80_031220 [Liparis tanakae]
MFVSMKERENKRREVEKRSITPPTHWPRALAPSCAPTSSCSSCSRMACRKARRSQPDDFWSNMPAWMTFWSTFSLYLAAARIFSSTLSTVQRRSTRTSFCWPMRLRPSPPARVLSRNTKYSEAGSLNVFSSMPRSSALVVPVGGGAQEKSSTLWSVARSLGRMRSSSSNFPEERYRSALDGQREKHERDECDWRATRSQPRNRRTSCTRGPSFTYPLTTPPE